MQGWFEGWNWYTGLVPGPDPAWGWCLAPAPCTDWAWPCVLDWTLPAHASDWTIALHTKNRVPTSGLCTLDWSCCPGSSHHVPHSVCFPGQIRPTASIRAYPAQGYVIWSSSLEIWSWESNSSVVSPLLPPNFQSREFRGQDNMASQARG